VIKAFIFLKNRILWIFIKGIFFVFGVWFLYLALRHRQMYKENCQGTERFDFQNYGKINDPNIDESSGLALEKDSLFWTHNDDTDSSLYLISARGNLKDKWPIPFKNRDWEEACKDKNQNLYVGDFGNNFELDRNLRILKISTINRKIIGEIQFKYVDEHNEILEHDCEAMVHWGDSLYLFTKSKTERLSNVYVVSDKPGKYKIRKKQSIALFGVVTAAALRPDGKELALLTYGKIYFYSLPDFVSGKIPASDFCFAYWNMRQSESICYWNSDSILLGNEQGNLYLMTRK